MINQVIEKSFDNIIYQQEKMDNKAYIFLGFLGFFITFDYFQINYVNLSTLNKSLILMLGIPLILSLLPIANNKTVKILTAFHEKKNGRKKKQSANNIFYYLDIFDLDKTEFLQLLEDRYDMDIKNDISKADEYLIEGILINSKILRTKVFFHNTVFFIFIFIVAINILIYVQNYVSFLIIIYIIKSIYYYV